MNHPLPSYISGYTLVSSLSDKSYPYVVGLYRKSGRKYVLKLWFGSRFSRNYFSLRHEAAVLRSLSCHTSLPVSPVPFVEDITSPSYVGFVTRYIDARPLSTVVKSVKSQLRIYDRCLKYLSTVNASCHPEIPVKGLSYLFLILPLITLTAIINSPKHAGLILRGCLHVLLGLPSLFSLPSLMFVHGDLHHKNILLAGNKIYLTDFEQAVFTFPRMEIITTLSSIRNGGRFNELLLSRLDFSSPDRVLLAYNSIYNLTSQLPAQNISHYTRLLTLATNNAS